MPDSASGVSTTRDSPKSFCRPSVTRKPPPSLPTPSPLTTTFGSSSSALRRPSLMAFDNVSVVIAPPPPGRRVQVGGVLLPLLAQQRGRLGVHVLEHRQRRRVRHLQAC